MHSSQFRRAMEIEWRDLCAKGVFGRTDHLKATIDSKVLLLMWIFTYKIDIDRYLSCFKARLIIYRDL
jgi:hypothetical protein